MPVEMVTLTTAIRTATGASGKTEIGTRFSDLMALFPRATNSSANRGGRESRGSRQSGETEVPQAVNEPAKLSIGRARWIVRRLGISNGIAPDAMKAHNARAIRAPTEARAVPAPAA